MIRNDLCTFNPLDVTSCDVIHDCGVTACALDLFSPNWPVACNTIRSRRNPIPMSVSRCGEALSRG